MNRELIQTWSSLYDLSEIKKGYVTTWLRKPTWLRINLVTELKQVCI